MEKIRVDELTNAHIGAYLRYMTKDGHTLQGRITDIAPYKPTPGEPTLAIITIGTTRTYFAPDAHVEVSLTRPPRPQPRTASRTGVTISTSAALAVFVLATVYGVQATEVAQTAVSLTGIICASLLGFRVAGVASRVQVWTR